MNIDRVCYWSRKVGHFVNRETGQDIKQENNYEDLTTLSLWYSSLTNLIVELADEIDSSGLTTVISIPDEAFFILTTASPTKNRVFAIPTEICSIGKYAVIPRDQFNEDFLDTVLIFNEKKSVAVKILNLLPF